MKINDKYYDWKIVSFDDRPRYGNYGVICKCKCGRDQWIQRNKLISGKSKRCRVCSNKIKALKNKKHGYATRKNRNPIYDVWVNMKERCYRETDSQYHNYGARGIKICDKWLSFENFLYDMGDPGRGYYIDRIDYNGDYTPENCRWVTPQESARNTRRCEFYMIDGEKLTQKETASRIGTSESTLIKYKKMYGKEIAVDLIVKNPWKQRNKMKDKSIHNAPDPEGIRRKVYAKYPDLKPNK